MGRPKNEAGGKKRKLSKGCYFHEEAAQRAVDFIECLKHTKGKWSGKPFKLLPWEKKIVREVFGTLKPNGKRLYKYVYIEIPKKNGKSELGAAIALYLLFGDGELNAEVYSIATDREQARIVFDVAAQMFEWEPGLQFDQAGNVRGKRIPSIYRIVNYELGGFYRVLSSDVASKHGYNVHGCVFDELHAQPNRLLYDVMSEGSGDAREQPLFVYLTTAGIDRNSVCWEMHERARKILNGTSEDPDFYPVIFGLDDEEEAENPRAWEDERVWKRCNPSLGHIISMATVREHFNEAKENPAKENNFRQLRLNQWVKSSIKPIPLRLWDACGKKFDPEMLKDLDCYGGLDLSSNIDLTALGLVFPDGQGEFYTLHRFWIPEDTMREKEKRDKVPYSTWVRRGYMTATPGNVIDYAFIIHELDELRKRYNLKEVAFDAWGATLIVQTLHDEHDFALDPKEAGPGRPMLVQFRQGYKSLSPPTKELITLVYQGKLHHGGNPVMRWNIDNLALQKDPMENLKPDKVKSTQRIDGAVALIMGLDRAIRHEGEKRRSAYEDEDLTII